MLINNIELKENDKVLVMYFGKTIKTKCEILKKVTPVKIQFENKIGYSLERLKVYKLPDMILIMIDVCN